MSILHESAFVYVDQLKHAVEAAILPNSEFIEAAAGYSMPAVAIVFNMGRCGTTLANHVLNASPEIVCLSEPSVFEQAGPYTGADRGDLVRAYVRQLFSCRHKKSAHVLGIKPRSQALFHAENHCAELPGSHNVFMYRDAVNWAHSFFDRLDRLSLVDAYSGEMIDRACHRFVRQDAASLRLKYLDFGADNIDPGTFWGHAWALHMETFIALSGKGFGMPAIRYNEFNTDRLTGVRHLMRACGVSADAGEDALAAFEADSQSGTKLGRVSKPKRLNAQNLECLLAAIAQHPGFEDPDTILN